jgi:glycosyltransferase involved in cell wall biosynthesis
MSIVIDARELRTTTGRYIERLIYYLQQVDNKHEYVVLLKPADMELWQPSAPNFSKLACPYREFTFAEQLGFAVQLMKLQPDLVHFGMVQQPLLYPGRSVCTMHDLTTVRFKNPSKNPIVYTIKQTVYRFVNWWAPRKSKLVFVPTKFVQNDIANFAHVPLDKFLVTYESADPITVPAEPYKKLDGKDFLLYVGRPMPHKNLEGLIAAYIQLRVQHPALQLVLAGRKDVNYERIERMVKQQSIPGIVFTDYISEGQLRWLYQHCQAYVVPSFSEGFGLPGLEAMINDAVVASSNATCLPEVYGDAATYFDPHSPDDMARVIHELLSSSSLRNTLRKKAKTRVARYSWKRMAEQTLDGYQRALGEATTDPQSQPLASK